MPSRKKAKGKARKAAKEAREEESRAVVNETVQQRQVQDESLEAQVVQRRMICQQCRHGSPSLSTDEKKICLEFIDAFIAAFNSQKDVGGGFTTATQATAIEYADVYSSKLDTVVSMLLASGTQRILGGDNRQAQLYAALACYYEEYMAFAAYNTKTMPCWTKIIELHDADDHTLVSYYRKRISCSCLDEKYKEVKSVTKMGWCFNPSCNLPERRVERSKMLCCTRCRHTNYCSVECQRANWNRHREVCGMAAEMKATFNSSQT